MFYIVEMQDGSVAIMQIVEQEKPEKGGIVKFFPDVQDEIKKWPLPEQKKVKSARPIDKSEIPLDRTFRNAWGIDLKTDMGKARTIHMDRIRAARNEAMKKLDIETMKGNDVQAKKQVLRDLPQNFDLTKAATPEELKDLWPEELKN